MTKKKTSNKSKIKACLVLIHKNVSGGIIRDPGHILMRGELSDGIELECMKQLLIAGNVSIECLKDADIAQTNDTPESVSD